MIEKIIYLICACLVGAVFAIVGVPAGWLIGALLTGIAARFFINHKLSFHPLLFRAALALIGVNIGLMIDLSLFSIIASFFLPLVVSIVLIFVLAWGLGTLLHHYTALDKKTALFCCVPGGASIMMALSEEYGADQKIVSAFHSARILLFVLLIPILAGWMTGEELNPSMSIDGSTFDLFSSSFTVLHFLIFIAMIAAAFLLTKIFPIPAGVLIFAMLVGFFVHEFIFSFSSVPSLLVGFGQVVIGALIGLRFDKKAFNQLKEIGSVSFIILFLYLTVSFFISWIFDLMTTLDFVTSMLGTVPAGAAEMASTAYLIDLDASVVASLQLVRLLILFFILPAVIAKLIGKEKTAQPHQKEKNA